MTDVLIAMLSTLAGVFINTHVKNAKAKKAAKSILEAVDNNITDPTVAMREAWVQANAALIKAGAAQLAAQVEANKIRVAASGIRAKLDATGIDAEVIPRDGTEEFKPGWPLK
jgi:hypothetical protein